MASAKQLAARRKFTKIMKSGGFKKRKSKTKTKTKTVTKIKTVIKRNSKKPKIIMVSINMVPFFKGCLRERELINNVLQRVKKTIHRNIDPS